MAADLHLHKDCLQPRRTPLSTLAMPWFRSKLSLQPKNNRERKIEIQIWLKRIGSEPAWAWPGLHAAWSRDLGLDLLNSVSVFFFSSGFFSNVLWCSRGSSLRFIRVINRVLETWFPCGCHVKKYATFDVIRPWQSSIWDSIYWPKLSLPINRVSKTRNASK